MRIAFVSLMAGMPWGGSEALWSKTALKSLEDGDTVLVSIYDWGKLPEQVNNLKTKGAIVHLRQRYNPAANVYRKAVTALRSRIKNTYQEIINFKPDIVLISQGDSFDLAVHHFKLYKSLSENSIPYALICHSHMQYSDIPNSAIYPKATIIFKNAAHVFFVSKRMLQITERKLCLKLENASITWNPLNLSTGNYIDYPKTEQIKFAIVGSLTGSKGHDTLFEVLSKKQWVSRDWHLNVYGDGYGATYLYDLARFYNLQNKITFHGHSKNIAIIWQTNSILLIPSATEGMPISLVEAMLCGRPAIVTDVGGNTELITEAESGFIAEAPSVSAFSKAMERAWLNRHEWKKMGQYAREKVLNKVELEPHLKLYIKLKLKALRNS